MTAHEAVSDQEADRLRNILRPADTADRRAAGEIRKDAIALLGRQETPPRRIDDPGETPLTRSGFNSAASTGTIASMPALTAASPAVPGIAACALTAETKVMLPPGCSSGSAAWAAAACGMSLV